MPRCRVAPWIALALLLLVAASPARAEGPPGPRIVSARADAGGRAELIVACPAGAAADLAISVDGGAFAPPKSIEREDAPPALAIIVERGEGMALAGTPHSSSAADALGARYAEATAPGALLRVVAPGDMAPGRHLVALRGCGGATETWVSVEAAAAMLDWRPPALAGAGGLTLGILVGRLGLGGRASGGGRRGQTPPAESRPPTPRRGEEAETERGARRRRDSAQPAYRLVAWAGERRITHELRERQCVIGHDPGCDLRIDGPSVADLHARISVAGGQITLADLDSAGGTTLGPGGPRLPAHRPTELQDGDEFWIGPEVRVALRRADEC